MCAQANAGCPSPCRIDCRAAACRAADARRLAPPSSCLPRRRARARACRWRRIDLVRKLATQAALEGTEGFNQHYVRMQKINVTEKIGGARRTAAAILQKQLDALRRDRDWGPPQEGACPRVGEEGVGGWGGSGSGSG